MIVIRWSICLIKLYTSEENFVRTITKVPHMALNKKILLHERKRHTTHCVASTHYAVPVGVPPILTWDGITPCPDLRWGYTPLSWPEMGYPPVLTWDGVPPILTLDGFTLHKSWPGMEVSPLPLARQQYTSPPHCPHRGVDWQTENSTLPNPSDADGNNYENITPQV